MEVLGVDIGGSGIKGAIVETETGQLQTERFRLKTPQPATPQAVAATLKELVAHFEWQGLIGCGFPAVVQQGVAKTASNIDKDWIGTNAVELFGKQTGCNTFVANDADAAGLAEVTFGAGRNQPGVTIIITIGTGLGSGTFVDGILVPNTELGHFQMHGDIAERYASDAARKKYELSWKKWGGRFNEYLQEVETLFSPDLIILGGGASKKHEKFFEYLDTNARVVPAQLRNEAGIVGAALFAKYHQEGSLA